MQLTTTPVLTLPKATHNFFVHCDASRVGLSCILIHNGKFIAYTSRKHKIQEKNYATHDQELADVVFVLKICSYCLFGAHFNGLINIKSHKNINLRQNRWF